MIWGSTSRPDIGDVVMSLFLLWGRLFMTGDGPKMTKNGRLVNNPKWSIWTLSDHFKQELIFCSEAPLQNPTLFIWDKKIIFA